MYLGKVVGTVVCERKYEGLGGQKLLLVQPLDHARAPSGPLEVAVDTVRAGAGERVFVACRRRPSCPSARASSASWTRRADASDAQVHGRADGAAPACSRVGGEPRRERLGAAGAGPLPHHADGDVETRGERGLAGGGGRG